MAITIIPNNGWAKGIEQFGSGIAAGLYKRAELAAKEKEPKSRLDKWLDLKMAQEMGTEPTKEEVLGETLPTSSQLGQVDTSFNMQLPPASVMDSYLKKKTGAVTDPLAQREAAIGALGDQAKIAPALEKQAGTNTLAVQKGLTGKTALSLQNLTRVTNAMTGMVATYKQAKDEQGGAGIIPSLTGNVKRAYANLGVDQNIPAEDQMSGLPKFKGQAREVTLALSPILTGSTRIMASVLSMLEKTIPQDLMSSEATGVGQMKQTFKNSYRLSLGLAQAGLTKEDIQSIESNSSEKQLNQLVKKLVGKGTMSKEDDAQFEEIWKTMKSTPAGKAETLSSGKGTKVGRFTVEEL